MVDFGFKLVFLIISGLRSNCKIPENKNLITVKLHIDKCIFNLAEMFCLTFNVAKFK